MRPLWLAVAAATLAMVGAQPAVASPNIGPSTAVEVAPGAPFSGSWMGTPEQHAVGGDNNDFWHWYRVNVGLRTGDQLQVSVDNSRSQEPIGLCLVSPTDEFGATTTLERECGRYSRTFVQPRALARTVLTYRPTQPNGFLVAQASDYRAPGYFESDGGQYTVTVERAITRVNIGFVPPAHVVRTLRINAALRYGDNTPVADGVAATLEYRPLDRRAPRRPFRVIGRSSSRDGSATFSARLPRTIAPAVRLRACAEQPGGTKPRCTRAYRVKVVGSAAGRTPNGGQAIKNSVATRGGRSR